MSRPVYNKTLIEVLEKNLAKSFERTINDALSEEAKMSIYKNICDSRFNFRTDSPKIVFRTIKKAVEQGDVLVRMMYEAFIEASKTDVLRRSREVTSVCISILIKMKLNPPTFENTRADVRRSKIASTTDLVTVTKIDPQQYFSISPPFEFNLGQLRQVMEAFSITLPEQTVTT